MKINKGLLDLSKKNADNEVIYSLVLRLRGIYLLKLMKEKNKYSNTEFLKWLEGSELNRDEVAKVYDGYKSIRDNKKYKQEIAKDIGEKLAEFLEKEVKKW